MGVAVFFIMGLLLFSAGVILTVLTLKHHRQAAKKAQTSFPSQG